MSDDSTNVFAPDLGPQYPVYPDLTQFCRVTTANPRSGNVYPAFTQQYVPSLTLRDREPCYVLEPNGIILLAAYYDCRLIGTYQGLPLYATTCCQGPAPSVSASPSSASPVPCILTRTAAGATLTSNSSTLTLPGITVNPGDVLVVTATFVAARIGSYPTAMTASWGGQSMELDNNLVFPNSPPGFFTLAGGIYCFSTLNLAPGTGDVVINLNAGSGALTIQASKISGLHVLFALQGGSNSGNLGTVSSGPTPGSGQLGCLAAIAGFLLCVPNNPSYTWSLGGFTDGGQGLTNTYTDPSTGLVYTILSAEGYRFSTPPASFDAFLDGSGFTANFWGGYVETFI